MEKVIFDCDNTLGIENCDVDDGLTLLFLLGSKEIDLQGVTLTYGNSTLDKVEKATRLLQENLGIEFPYYLGTEDRVKRDSEASRFLAECVAENPGEITVIATGSLTNLLGAATYNPLFFSQVKSIILMGGTVEPLKVNGRPVTELNFTCDPQATETVILSEAPLVVMNGHMTAQALFSDTMIDQMIPDETKGGTWLKESLNAWCKLTKEYFDLDGFCNWDMATAMYLIHPEYFSRETYYLTHSQDLSQGRLTLTQERTEHSDKIFSMPENLLDLTGFNRCMSETIRGYLEE